MSRLWSKLELLHYDLNTCLCETTVVLRSFLHAMPGEALKPVKTGLSILASGASHIGNGACPQMPGSGLTPVPQLVEPIPPPSCQITDNLGSRERIPYPRMRPDGTGGPNETI
jgi:hypothetical protein